MPYKYRGYGESAVTKRLKNGNEITVGLRHEATIYKTKKSIKEKMEQIERRNEERKND